MYLHANAKLGLAGRLALVRAVEDGMSLQQAAVCFSVSPAIAHRWWHRWLDAGEDARRTLACLLDRSSRPYRSPRQLAPELAEVICACRRKTGWRTAAGCRRDRVRALDRVEGVEAGRHFEATTASARAGQQLRMALPRRPAAHGHQRVRALPAARSRTHRRPLKPRPPPPRRASTSCTRSSTTTRPARLRRDPRRPTGHDRHRFPRTRSRLLPSTRDHRPAADDRQRLGLHPQPSRPPAAHPPPDPSPHHQALPAPHQRQGRTPPPNDGPRMGLRTHLQLTPRPRHRSATLAPPLQHHAATQLTRRPTPDQPRSQRPWAGHLAGGGTPKLERDPSLEPERAGGGSQARRGGERPERERRCGEHDPAHRGADDVAELP